MRKFCEVHKNQPPTTTNLAIAVNIIALIASH